jgi:acyl carrier protein
MMDHERVLRIVYDAIDVVNQQLPASKRLHKSPDTVIAGAGGSLDSLGIVTFVILLEEKVGEAFGTTVQLLDEQMLIEDSPFQSIGALTDYIATRAV